VLVSRIKKVTHFGIFNLFAHNARAHMALSIHQESCEKQTCISFTPPLSPDLSPADLHQNWVGREEGADNPNFLKIIHGIHSFVISLEGRAWQEPEPSHATGMALAHCILGKFLGVVCHCFPLPLDVPTLAARCLRPQRRERS